MPVTQSHESPPPPTVPVCGIGASAGGVEALQQFFATVPSDLGLAYVVIVHLAPDHKSELPSIIARWTTMPVLQVVDHEKTKLTPNHVYVIAPDRKLEITDSTVASSPFDQPRGQRTAIDLVLPLAGVDARRRLCGGAVGNRHGRRGRRQADQGTRRSRARAGPQRGGARQHAACGDRDRRRRPGAAGCAPWRRDWPSSLATRIGSPPLIGAETPSLRDAGRRRQGAEGRARPPAEAYRTRLLQVQARDGAAPPVAAHAAGASAHHTCVSSLPARRASRDQGAVRRSADLRDDVLPRSAGVGGAARTGDRAAAGHLGQQRSDPRLGRRLRHRRRSVFAGDPVRRGVRASPHSTGI